jgi:hypothetical protein
VYVLAAVLGTKGQTLTQIKQVRGVQRIGSLSCMKRVRMCVRGGGRKTGAVLGKKGQTLTQIQQVRTGVVGLGGGLCGWVIVVGAVLGKTWAVADTHTAARV